MASHIFDARKRVYILAGRHASAAISGSLPPSWCASGHREPVPAAPSSSCWLGRYRLPCGSLASLGTGRAAGDERSDFTIADVSRDVSRHRHLQVIIALLLVTYVVDTLVEYQFSYMAREFYRGDSLTAFLGGFYGLYLNLTTFVLQVFLTSLVVNRFGVGGTLLVMPAGIGAAMAAMVIAPGIWAAGIARLIKPPLLLVQWTSITAVHAAACPYATARKPSSISSWTAWRGAGALLILSLSALAPPACGLSACSPWQLRR